MTLSPKVQTVLINVAKNAVNAALTALGPVAAWHYHLNTMDGWKHIGIIMGSAAIARELIVYVPKILAWSATSTDNAQP